MPKSHLSRRLNKIFTSPIFMTLTIVFIVAIIAYISFFTEIINKKKPIVSSVNESAFDLNLHFISYTPSDATDSAKVVQKELDALSNTPFQINSLNQKGELSNTPASDPSNIVYTLIDQNTPTVDNLRFLYQLWSLIKQDQTLFEAVYLTRDHFGVIFSNSSFVLFKNDQDPSLGLNSLQQIRLHSTMNLDGAFVDLRFDKPIIIQNINLSH